MLHALEVPSTIEIRPRIVEREKKEVKRERKREKERERERKREKEKERDEDRECNIFTPSEVRKHDVKPIF